MHVIAILAQAGDDEFLAFEKKGRASQYWSNAVDQAKRGEASVQGKRAFKLFVIDGDDEEAALSLARKGEVEAVKTFDVENYVPLSEKAAADETMLAIDFNDIAAAEKDVEELTDTYQSWVKSDVKLLQDRINLIKSTGDFDENDYRTMHDIAYNLTGMGGTFNYPMVSFLGVRLMYFIETLENKPLTNAHLQILSAYLSALKIVVAKGIKGNGGALGRKLLDNLNSVILKFSGREKAKAKPKPEPKSATKTPQVIQDIIQSEKNLEENKVKVVKNKPEAAQTRKSDGVEVEKRSQEKTAPNAMSQEELSRILNDKK
ncbi:hypothetical protein [Terasakiella sp. SH-1]|uniref:hypothetical protein n=1 Tax=Terasakiella sp. SH-1 TaxID=2560057 RepID=UPI0010736B36|nr:hypothetical protein [Terasakiella sp. SH-1]